MALSFYSHPYKTRRIFGLRRTCVKPGFSDFCVRIAVMEQDLTPLDRMIAVYSAMDLTSAEIGERVNRTERTIRYRLANPAVSALRDEIVSQSKVDKRFDGYVEKALVRLDEILSDEEISPAVLLRAIELVFKSDPSGTYSPQSKTTETREHVVKTDMVLSVMRERSERMIAAARERHVIDVEPGVEGCVSGGGDGVGTGASAGLDGDVRGAGDVCAEQG